MNLEDSLLLDMKLEICLSDGYDCTFEADILKLYKVAKPLCGELGFNIPGKTQSKLMHLYCNLSTCLSEFYNNNLNMLEHNISCDQVSSVQKLCDLCGYIIEQLNKIKNALLNVRLFQRSSIEPCPWR